MIAIKLRKFLSHYDASILKRIRVWLWRFEPAMIHHSLDGRYYYITLGNRLPRYWFSIEKRPGTVPDERKKDAMIGWLEIRKTNGEVYYREILSFTFFKVESAHDEQRVSLDSDEFRDYAAHHGW